MTSSRKPVEPCRERRGATRPRSRVQGHRSCRGAPCRLVDARVWAHATREEFGTGQRHHHSAPAPERDRRQLRGVRDVRSEPADEWEHKTCSTEESRGCLAVVRGRPHTWCPTWQGGGMVRCETQRRNRRALSHSPTRGSRGVRNSTLTGALASPRLAGALRAVSNRYDRDHREHPAESSATLCNSTPTSRTIA
jgi:hypothetical protein